MSIYFNSNLLNDYFNQSSNGTAGLRPGIVRRLMKYDNSNTYDVINCSYRQYETENMNLCDLVCMYQKEIPEALELFKYLLETNKFNYPNIIIDAVDTCRVDFVSTVLFHDGFTRDNLNMSGALCRLCGHHPRNFNELLDLLLDYGVNVNQNDVKLMDNIGRMFGNVSLKLERFVALMDKFNAALNLKLLPSYILLNYNRIYDQNGYKIIDYLLDTFEIDFDVIDYAGSNMLESFITRQMNISVIEKLISRGAPVNDNAMTVLAFSQKLNYDLNVLTLLLKNGANLMAKIVTAKTSEIMHANIIGDYCLSHIILLARDDKFVCDKLFTLLDQLSDNDKKLIMEESAILIIQFMYFHYLREYSYPLQLCSKYTIFNMNDLINKIEVNPAKYGINMNCSKYNKIKNILLNKRIN